MPLDYVYAYFVILLPTLFVLGAGFFALATATRSMMATYVGVVAFLILFFVLTALFQKPEYDHIVGIDRTVRHRRAGRDDQILDHGGPQHAAAAAGRRDAVQPR